MATGSAIAQTLVNIGNPYEDHRIIASTPVPANQVIFGPVTRSTLLLSCQLYWGSASSQSAGISLIHDPSTGPVGTGSAITGSAILINASGATVAYNWALTGSLQLNPGDWVSMNVLGSAVATGQVAVTIQALPN